MNPLEIIILIIFSAASILLLLLAVSTLQLIKELKTSLRKLNKILEKPENINSQFTHRFADTLGHDSYQPKLPRPSPPRFFRRQKRS